MKKYTTLLLVFMLSGCTHVSISDPTVLQNPEIKPHIPKDNLQDFPLAIDASVSCYKHREGNQIIQHCSNKGRINTIVNIFNERGLRAIPHNDTSTAHISVQTDEMNGFLEGVTGFFNVLTMGVLPLYHYDDYTVTYKDAPNNIDISKTVRISSTTTWFSLLQSNPENLEKGEIKYRTEKNLIRAVLNDAKVGG